MEESRANMSVLEMRGNWNIIKGRLRQRWARLTDDDLQFVEGKERELIGRIQGVFMRLGSEWEGFAAVPDEFVDVADVGEQHIDALVSGNRLHL